MAGEGDVKTKTGLMKAMSRALQNEAYYGDTTQFETKEFQEIILLLRQLNHFEQQLLLSGQHILFRGKLAGMSVSRIQELIPEVRAWLEEIDSKEHKLTQVGPKGGAAAVIAMPATGGGKKEKPGTDESAANAGAFFEGGKPGSGKKADKKPPEEPTYYYGDHRFGDGELVQIRYTTADKRIDSMQGIYIMTTADEEAARKAGVVTRSEYTYDTDPDTVARYRKAIEKEKAETRPASTGPLDREPPEGAEKEGGGSSKKPAAKKKAAEVSVH